MADMTRIKGRIQEVIRPNGVGAITAAEHQSLLLEMVDDINNKKADQSELIATKEGLNALEQKVDNLPQGEEFDKQGNYPLLHVGTADDLAGRGESVPAEFGFRASGGKSIKDGRAYIKRIKGNSVVWNQLSGHGATSLSQESWEGNRVTINGTFEQETSIFDTESRGAELSFPNVGNKCLVIIRKISGKVLSGEVKTFAVSIVNGNNIAFSADSTESYKVIFSTFKEGITYHFYRRYLAGTVCENLVLEYQFIDLTKAFPNDWQNINTIEEFNARVATLGVDLNAYNEGQVIHCNTESIKSVGDNAWDGVLATSFETSKIRCLSNEQYCLCGPYYNSGYHSVIFYDSEDNEISRSEYMVTFFLFNKDKSIFTTPANCAYFVIKFNVNYPPSDYKDQIVISLYHSGWKAEKDNQYQPYWQDTLPLPIIRKYFSDGMKSAGTAHDEIRYNKVTQKWEMVKRIGEVDMGSMTWNYIPVTSDQPFGRLSAALSDKKIQKGNLFTIYHQHLGSTTSIDKNIYGAGSEATVILTDSAYTDAASFKAAMQGVMLYYELAEPIVTELDEADQNFRDYYNVADFGTEMSQSAVPSAPFSADIIYQFNAVDMIREHEIEITELQSIIAEQQSVIATMQAQLTSLINGGQ